jgi:L-iditol 2-dehydrogenase
MTGLPSSTQAALMHEYGADLQVGEVPLPQPEPGALVVKVDVSSVCGSDVHTWQGSVSPLLSIKPPLILGHEIVGTVVAAGPGADADSVGTPLRPGDRVIWEHEACRRCEACVVLREPTMCTNRRIGMFHDATTFPYSAGGFAEYSYIWPGSGRIRVPGELPGEFAAAGSCALRTVINAFERTGSIDTSSRVLIQGSGPLGLFGVAVASRFNPRQLIVIGAPAERLEVARAWGATDVISVQDHDADARIGAVNELTSGGADVLFEMSGAPGAFAEGLKMARRAARYMVVGTVGGPSQAVDASRIVARQMTVMGTLSSDIGAYHKAVEFLVREAAAFNWSAMFSDRRYALSEATQALDSLRTMKEIKPLITPSA